MILLCKLLITMVLVSGLKNGEGRALLILKKFIKISKVIAITFPLVYPKNDL